MSVVPRGAALAVLSGALSYAACLAGDEGTCWGAGIAFGLLVLGPRVRAALWGAAEDAAIGVAVEAPDESVEQRLFLFAGFVAWQMGYTLSHRLAPWRRAAPA